MIEEKMIKWAISQGFYDEEDIPSMNEIDEHLISLSYKLHHDEKIPGTHYRRIVDKNGTENNVIYEGYFNESYEEAKARGAKFKILDKPIDEDCSEKEKD